MPSTRLGPRTLWVLFASTLVIAAMSSQAPSWGQAPTPEGIRVDSDDAVLDAVRQEAQVQTRKALEARKNFEEGDRLLNELRAQFSKAPEEDREALQDMIDRQYVNNVDFLQKSNEEKERQRRLDFEVATREKMRGLRTEIRRLEGERASKVATFHQLNKQRDSARSELVTSEALTRLTDESIKDYDQISSKTPSPVSPPPPDAEATPKRRGEPSPLKGNGEPAPPLKELRDELSKRSDTNRRKYTEILKMINNIDSELLTIDINLKYKNHSLIITSKRCQEFSEERERAKKGATNAPN
jgi:hypothetical protein